MASDTTSPTPPGSTRSGTGGALLLFVALYGGCALWSAGSGATLPAPLLAALGAALGFAGLLATRGRITLAAPEAWCAGLGLVFVTDVLDRSWNLFQGPVIRGEILLFTLATWVLLRARRLDLIALSAVAVPVILALSFHAVAEGRLLFSDDHPVFLFRLESLKRNFPLIPFYNPLWNGGIDARDFFATGALNVFIPFALLIYLFDTAQIYNSILILLAFGVFPLSLYGAARFAGAAPLARALTVLLGLTMSLLWYRWLLKYGTLGFVTSASLLPLVLALGARLIDPDHRERRVETALFILTCTLMLMWSLAGPALIPLGLLAAWRLPRLIRKPAFLATAIFLIIINLPWMALFWRVSNVSRFVTAERPSYAQMHEPAAPAKDFRHASGPLSFDRAVRALRESAVSANPIIPFLLLPGLLLLNRRQRIPFALTGGWLLLLGTVLVPVKPQLELDRMLLMLLIIGSVPAGIAAGSILERGAGSTAGRRIIPALLGGFLGAAPFVTGSVVLNRSVEQFHFAEAPVEELARAVSAHGGVGRVLFSGFVLHEWSHGHLAPLIYMTGRPLVASSYAHDQWRYRQVFPDEFVRRGEAGVLEYLDLLNVSTVTAHEPRWLQFFSERPTLFTEVARAGKFTLFRRQQAPPGWFLEGAGRLDQQSEHELRLTPATPDLTIRFNWFPFLESSACTIAGQEVGAGISFIRLTGCPVGVPVSIRSVGPIRRLFS